MTKPREPGTRTRAGEQRAASPVADLLGLAEAAALLGVSKSAVCQRRELTRLGRGRVPFPKPVAELASGPVWRRHQLMTYAERYTLGDEARVESPEEKRRQLARLERILMTLELGQGETA
jgi:hypothetical protein